MAASAVCDSSRQDVGIGRPQMCRLVQRSHDGDLVSRLCHCPFGDRSLGDDVLLRESISSSVRSFPGPLWCPFLHLRPNECVAGPVASPILFVFECIGAGDAFTGTWGDIASHKPRCGESSSTALRQIAPRYRAHTHKRIAHAR